MNKYAQLVTKLKEIFQIDRPELDFGVYRILNQRSDEINEFLEHRLKEKIETALAGVNQANLEQLNAELKKASQDAENLGMMPSDAPKVQDIKKKIAYAKGASKDYENTVYSHLLTFFSRYYDKGDFISQRRYKGDTYAIPYAGEEVMLHWANKDQYYIKSGENFSNYSFTLDDGRTVHFRLVAADTAKDNRKDNDKDRCFVLATTQTLIRTDDEGETYQETITPIEEVKTADGKTELIIHFEYKALPKGNKQTKLTEQAIKAIEKDKLVTRHWLDLLNREPTEKNPTRTLLEKKLTHYTAKNTSDYFIHKDLGKFLRGELDFYIKNEVMHLDDVQDAEKFSDIKRNLHMIQCLRSIAQEVISFLAQIEDFQKKLWLKKKFVISSHYCITLDRVPEELYPEIVANKKQWDQWRELGFIDKRTPATKDYLFNNTSLLVDTSIYPEIFKLCILNQLEEIDDNLGSVLINSDNYQAINLLKNKYSEKVTTIYIDPPYNTEKDREEGKFIYKDGFSYSSWLTMIYERISASYSLLGNEGSIYSSIGSEEIARLKIAMDEIFGNNLIVNAIWISGRTSASHFTNAHEYILGYAKDKNKMPLFSYTGSDSIITDRAIKKPGVKNPLSEITFPAGIDFESEDKIFPNKFGSKEPVEITIGVFESKNRKLANEVTISAGWAMKDMIMKWLKGEDVIDSKGQKVTRFYFKSNGVLQYEKERGTMHPSSVISDYTTKQGTNTLANLLGSADEFDYPKPPNLISYFIGPASGKDGLILDYFAGSGTTGQSVINLNRNDGGQRKCILIEQGSYLNSIIVPRIKKVVFSADWKDGKPTAPETGISHCFKVLKLESYEDALNNLELRRINTDLFDNNSHLKDDYQINYMLDMESRGSLLSTDDFKKPFDYEMKIAVDSAGAYKKQKVDLVETFNYLIGLTVNQYDYNIEKGYVCVEGTLPDGEKTLIFWRDCDKIDYDKLLTQLNRFDLEAKDNAYDVIYINGDHNVPSLYEQTQKEGGAKHKLKLRQIEPEFLSRMFDVEVV